MRHDGQSGVDVMDPETSEKYKVHYYQQELPNRLFAIIRMTWRREDGIVAIDEVKLIDEGTETIEGFAEVMEQAIEGGAEISIICPYDPEHIGLY